MKRKKTNRRVRGEVFGQKLIPGTNILRQEKKGHSNINPLLLAIDQKKSPTKMFGDFQLMFNLQLLHLNGF